MMKKLVLLFCYFLFAHSSFAFTLSEKAEISIITCDPWDQLYALFGHTAMRIRDTDNKIDEVFNYGTFNFNTPNFYIKFMRGLLPYQLTSSSYSNFIREYQYKNISVYSQTLLLDSVQKQKLVDLLVENLQPQNRTYLYNFLYDNCSTRCRDIVVKTIGDEIDWGIKNENKNFWNLLDEYLYVQPWSQWGIHTVLGQKGVHEASNFEYMFLPYYLMSGLKTATYNNKRIASDVKVLYKATQSSVHKTHVFTSPIFVFLMASLCVIGIVFFSKSKKLLNIFLVLLFLSSGIVGCLIVFLGFFTLHPLTFPNWNILWANPLNLFVILLLINNKARTFLRIYLKCNVVLLGCTCLLWFFLQPAVVLSTYVIMILLLMIQVHYLKVTTNFSR